MKKGITLLVLVVTVLCLSILAGTVVLVGNDIVGYVNKNKFGAEILNIQNSVDNYYTEHEKYPIGENIEFNISNIGIFGTNQFANEIITDNIVILAKIDFSKLGIKETIFGKNSTETDIYAVSETTGKVYYLEGFLHNGETHYIANNKLGYKGYPSQAEILTKYKYEVRKKDVIFKLSDIDNVNEAIKMTVLIPNIAVLNSINTTNDISVGNTYFNDQYMMIDVNNENTKGSYEVVITYTLNGVQNVITYAVNNSDIQGPNIEVEVESFNGYTVLNLNVQDNISEISSIKYETAEINDVTYFDKYGKIITDSKIVCYKEGTYTIFAKDKLGNTTMLTQNVEVDLEN